MAMEKILSSSFYCYRVKGMNNYFYFATRKTAKEFANRLADKLQPAKIKRVHMVRDHSAIAKGYVGANNAHIESYSGRFGQGFTWHETTKQSNHGNGYHCITYYIESEV